MNLSNLSGEWMNLEIQVRSVFNKRMGPWLQEILLLLLLLQTSLTGLCTATRLKSDWSTYSGRWAAIFRKLGCTVADHKRPVYRSILWRLLLYNYTYLCHIRFLADVTYTLECPPIYLHLFLSHPFFSRCDIYFGVSSGTELKWPLSQKHKEIYWQDWFFYYLLLTGVTLVNDHQYSYLVIIIPLILICVASMSTNNLFSYNYTFDPGTVSIPST